jgi:adenylate cyclase
VRLTLMNGIVLVALLSAVGFVFYDFAYASEFKALQDRIRATVTMTARMVDGTAMANAIRSPGGDEPAIRTLAGHFHALMEADNAITSVYLMTAADPVGAPAAMTTVIDTVRQGVPDPPGHTYDASALPLMQQGFQAVTVEDRMYYEDDVGYSLSGYAPVKGADGRPLALVGLDIKASHVHAIQGRVLTVVGIIVGVAVALLMVFALILGRRIKRPIEQMSSAADRIARGDFDLDVGVRRNDEFGLMADHLQTIAHSLRERDLLRDTFGRYVSPDIARKLLSDRSAGALGGEDREVTVVFSDIEGYSTMTELVSPQEVVGLLNTYLGAMNTILDRYEGCIIEIIGDAILAVFNAPNDVPGHAEAAVRCAIDMRDALERLNDEWSTTPIARIWQQAGKERLRARVGIHSGHVVAGNIGSKTRMKYGLIGDVVNVAARIEALNKTLKTNLLVSDATWQMLPDDLKQRGESRGAHQVKGRSEGVAIHAY